MATSKKTAARKTARRHEPADETGAAAAAAPAAAAEPPPAGAEASQAEPPATLANTRQRSAKPADPYPLSRIATLDQVRQAGVTNGMSPAQIEEALSRVMSKP